MSALHPDREVLVTPLDPKHGGLNGTYVAIVFPGFPKLLLTQDDFDKVQALIGTELPGRQITVAPADDGVRIRVRAVPS